MHPMPALERPIRAGALHRRAIARSNAGRRPRRGALIAACMVAVAAGLHCGMARSLSAAPLSAAAMTAQLYPDSACADQQIVGQCFCGALPCGLRVRRYVPVALVETTRAPGDSLLGVALPVVSEGAASVSSSLSATDNTAEAHVWSLSDGPVPGLSCFTCGAAGARRPVAPVDPSAALCGPATAVGEAILAAAAAISGPAMPTLAYASELDLFNWRTGCRDLVNPATSVVSRLLACAASAAGTAADADGFCLADWGNLLPRQMRDVGPPPLLHSAKTSLRAMSIARDQIGSFPYPVDTQGKLQQVYPATSACFRVGRLPLPQRPAAARPVVPSADGRYAWLYWRQTTCCIGSSTAQACLRAH